MRKFDFMNNSTGYFEMLGQRESSGNYRARNPQGYLGKYQMGEYAMIDAGHYKKNYNVGSNDWSGKFTTAGVNNAQDFLNNEKVQEDAVRAYTKKNWEYIKNYATKYDGEVLNGVPLTQSGMLAGAHLVGQKDLIDYLKSGGKHIPKDHNGVPITEYIEKFGGYDVTDITKTPPKENKYDVYQKIMNPIYKSMPTGYGAPVEDLVQQSQSDLAGYINPLTGTKQIFTREDVGAMTPDEFSKHEKEIDAQLKAFNGTMPSNSDLQRESISGGGVVYVHPYTRSDGTEVRGYYRSR